MSWQKELAEMATESEKTAVSKALSANDRKAAERKRKRAAGLVPVEVWIKEGKKSELAEAVARINAT